jgi:hypothetical protein
VKAYHLNPTPSQSFEPRTFGGALYLSQLLVQPKPSGSQVEVASGIFDADSFLSALTPWSAFALHCLT